LERDRYLTLLRADGDALAAAAEKDLGAHVPSCPEWDVAELVRHTSEVHRHKAAVIRASGQMWAERETGPQDPNQVVAWYREGLEDLLHLFETTDDDAPAKTWGTGTTVGWWVRRMAQETAVHRWDAENTVGEAAAIDPELASDGIDEFFSEFVPGEEIPWNGPAGTIHFHCTDVAGEWTVTLEPGTVPTYETGHSKGDAAVRGAASDVLLFVWRRVGSDAVEILGDTTLADAFWKYLEGPGQ
jgi:uncharacterized protein (TIGR03083 family)